MANGTWLLAIYALWTLWGAVWLALGLWANRTTRAATRDVQAPYRIVNLAGWVCLFGDAWLYAGPYGAWARRALPALWQVPPSLGWGLAGVVALGVALAFWARATLGRLWSAAVTRKEGHRLIEEGPYGLVRHPIYTALLIGAAGLAAARGTPVALAGFVLMAIGYTLKARVEERFLAAELGAATYADYRRRVPMLVPFARRPT